jgi:hypothetical protein
MMTAGSVTVNDNETHSGTGMALAIYEALKTAHASELPDPDAGAFPPPDLPEGTSDADREEAEAKTAATNAQMRANKVAARVRMLRRDAADATAIATAVVAHIQANAVVSLSSVVATVSPSASVGRTPDPNDPGAAIQGPLLEVQLPVTGAAGATTLGVQ